ncbi:DegV family protein [Halalkalibacillus halophilus]|uniref:DegV family protein n=1 Tax=Halalkalibacillus halophilus TaxID=392827 RepID=UPI00040F1130|nr:DegV family protein [Halalkalibacillus halophilus]
MKVAWLTDSAIYIPEGERVEDIYTLPLQISIDGENFKEDIDIEKDEFYDKIRHSEAAVKTSQPAVGDILNTFEEIRVAGYTDVVCVHISAGLSGTYETVEQTAKDVDGLTVHMVDSKMISYPMYKTIQQGKRMIEEGYRVPDVQTSLSKAHESFEAKVYVANIKYAYLGGRINAFAYNLGKTLKIHPILQLQDGKFDLDKKIRTEKKSVAYFMDQVEKAASQQHIKELSILHCNNHELANSMLEQCKQISNIDKIHVGALGPIIAAHGGEGSFAITWTSDEDYA